MGLDPDISAYYDRGKEQARLVTEHSLERVRTCELLERFLPAAPARVLDVGGGPGVYADWLADRGYDVHLVDPVPLHVEQAAAVAQGRYTVALGDARALDASDESVDVVLLFGPLYHLIDAEDRARTLAEAIRVVRRGGLVLAAAINRWAGLLDVVVHEYDHVAPDALLAYVEGFATTGCQRAGETPGFTTAYFHRAAELRAELEQSGLDGVQVLGIEGPGGWVTDAIDRLADPRRRELLLRAAELVEGDPELAGLSPHLLGIGRRVA
jgi:SAM-dependent methyltransferase